MFRVGQRALWQTLSRASIYSTIPAASRSIHTQFKATQRSLAPSLLFGSAVALSLALSVQNQIHLDEEQDVTLDPATSIAFPNTLKIQSKSPLPTFTLLGVGVRTVSFLGLKVYSVGLYVDLTNPNIPKGATPEETLDYLVRNCACVLRIMPTRSTSYSHLRDGFVRTLQARTQLCRQRGLLSNEEEHGIQSPLRKFKSMFPNTPLTKHTPLDILLLAPEPGQPRSLIVRDLGAVQNDWLAREFFLAYFEGDGISPPMKSSVLKRLQDVAK
ncbi:chalcone-flavanone isomerase-domain-containing protein [Abortiporus biennis]|nr:chalcone-flavanone isomerase-domain-containing protein [Abortiporus biennis]